MSECEFSSFLPAVSKLYQEIEKASSGFQFHIICYNHLYLSYLFFAELDRKFSVLDETSEILVR
jgi:hypothetical protein